ncbi:sensor domain-containing diguanylate cyclase [Psychrosphaera sp. B3R10]|uniref:Sensor domain-containing diguanylate cyclase n=1 Tax=Psychrosphaera algicola TaxID=3023714 RepID=A0ABT5FH69_9GAMM|nr:MULTISPECIES: sensor domain-containing diguanylate cyclase [unclassified Psychrosphaera]MBU2882894.1 sensor domain-containing diguanylate cyclase [Psychrosphaera sp. I2R16]MBU2991291.1 sensor domain-containing diguanylate cyclase [Psychrosphaera sp. B3R10]MDC2890542.1 sensor domain-containing diguanylate cyclase [Psychrosphaera sp. G1-22]MDO6720180.1 sensor domain-containing diguanylate cyclase [Psychrosphaera sp. 1_MG-2023]
MNKSGLLIRLALIIIFAALAIGFLSAQIFYRITYLDTVQDTKNEISQLYSTVSATASVAAYLEDTEMANDVLKGLVSNNVVLAAEFKTSNLKLIDGVLAQSDNAKSEFDIPSPFIKEDTVGKLILYHDEKYIQQHAQQIGQNNATALVTQAIFVTLITIFIAYVLITKPILSVGSALGKVKPGTEDRLSYPVFHTSSEIGVLVDDVNFLLDKAYNSFQEETKLRQDIEFLEKRFRMLFENSISPIILTEPSGNIILFNKAFEVLLSKLGKHFKKNFGVLLEEIFVDREQLKDVVELAISSDEIATGEFKLVSEDPSSDTVWVQIVVTTIVSEDLKEYYQLTLHDISKRRKQLEKLSELADYDQLTNILNRHGAEVQIKQLIADQIPFAFILLDLNGFKQVNDIYGHDAGDEILRHVAKQLLISLRKRDIACRWGGDEFVVVLPGISKEDLVKLSEKIYDKIAKPYYLNNQDMQVAVGSSMGVTFYPDDHTDLKSLVKLADQAMYRAKRNKQTAPSEYIKFAFDQDSSGGVK